MIITDKYKELLVLTEQQDLLKILLNQKVSRLIKVAMLKFVKERKHSVALNSYFQHSGWSLVLGLTNGWELLLVIDDSQGSILVRLEKTPEISFTESYEESYLSEDIFLIEATSEQYCVERIKNLIGQKITGLKIIKRKKLYEEEPQANEAGIMFEFENKEEMVFYLQFPDGSNIKFVDELATDFWDDIQEVIEVIA